VFRAGDVASASGGDTLAVSRGITKAVCGASLGVDSVERRAGDGVRSSVAAYLSAARFSAAWSCAPMLAIPCRHVVNGWTDPLPECKPEKFPCAAATLCAAVHWRAASTIVCHAAFC